MGEELVMDRFRLLERIGSGGMGTVYRAFDERLQRAVAVKEVIAADPSRVLREAQAAARLNHPGIVTLYELGESAGRAMLISELVPGETLARLRAAGAITDREVAEIGADLCDALAHAHEGGVVHRDVKPENVIVRDDQGAGRRAKLMDFGIARLTGAPALTARGEVVGTLAYMSPEQAEGLEAGPASDVYSLALTLYECWSAVNPVAGRTPAETARRIGAEIPPLRLLRPDLPAGLSDTIDACLDPDPELRPSVAELAEALGEEMEDVAELLVPADEPAPGGAAARLELPRLGALIGIAAALVLVAGPLGAPGAALVLAALSAPLLVIGAPLVALLAPVAPLLAAIGLAGAAPALGAGGSTRSARLVLGAAAWAWLLAASVALGVGPDLDIVPAAPDGWAADPALAADSVLAALIEPEALLGMAVFALAATVLGALLTLRHASVALLGAMLWAAAVNAALTLVGNGELGANPGSVVIAAAAAVTVEFAVLRGAEPVWRAPPRADGSRPVTT